MEVRALYEMAGLLSRVAAQAAPRGGSASMVDGMCAVLQGLVDDVRDHPYSEVRDIVERTALPGGFVTKAVAELIDRRLLLTVPMYAEPASSYVTLNEIVSLGDPPPTADSMRRQLTEVARLWVDQVAGVLDLLNDQLMRVEPRPGRTVVTGAW